MFYRFRFEEACYPALNRLPLHMRMKLDLTGIKISLQDWLSFAFEERSALCHLPVDSEDEVQAFVAFVDFLCRKYRGAPLTPADTVSRSIWDTADRLPDAVREKERGTNPPVTVAEWKRWKSHQRYALYKTAASQSEPEAFFLVLNELREREGRREKAHD